MVTLSVPDMHCGGCQASVEKALAPLAREVSVDLPARRVTVADASDATPIIVALNRIGFPAEAVAD